MTLHYDPGRGIRRKNQNDNMDKNAYKYSWGHPGLLGNVWHIRPFGTFMTSQCTHEDDPFLPSRKNVKFTEHFIKSTDFTSMPTERFSE